MLTKRIVPCLDIKDGRTVKGVKFQNLRDAGDPVDLAARYVEEGADELVFLDVTATVEKRKALCQLVERIAERINIPFTVGGGISHHDDVKALLNSGADKVSVNSAAVRNPMLINTLASLFGSQCIVVAIDAQLLNGVWKVCIDGGRTPVEKEVLTWVNEIEQRGAGEMLVTSMEHDGEKKGFACDLIKEISLRSSLPVIASGGAGKIEHFKDVFIDGAADAALAASVFHFEEIKISELKRTLANFKIPMRI